MAPQEAAHLLRDYRKPQAAVEAAPELQAPEETAVLLMVAAAVAADISVTAVTAVRTAVEGEADTDLETAVTAVRTAAVAAEILWPVSAENMAETAPAADRGLLQAVCLWIASMLFIRFYEMR